jgi:hypothetical protein
MTYQKAAIAFGLILEPIAVLLAHAVPLGPTGPPPSIKLHYPPDPFNQAKVCIAPDLANRTLTTICKWEYTEK